MVFGDDDDDDDDRFTDDVLSLMNCNNFVFAFHLVQLQIEEITRRLRTGELGIPPNVEDR